MKRGGPLRRRKPLQARQGLKQAGTLKRTRLRQRAATRWQPPGEAREEAMQRAAAWRAWACRAGTCAACGLPPTPTDPLEAHHVLPQQQIKKHVQTVPNLSKLGRYLLLQDWLWDKRNGMPLHRSCHDLHTRGKRPVSYSRLTAEHLQFAAALGMVHVLERQYQGGSNT